MPLEAEQIGSRLEPFVDDYLIDRLTGAAQARRCSSPTPREVVLTADEPWEGNTSAYYTVFQDGDNYRMYYRGSHFDEQTEEGHATARSTCYAESTDGIHWTKPELGLFEFNGSKQNNIVWDAEGRTASRRSWTPIPTASRRRAVQGPDARQGRPAGAQVGRRHPLVADGREAGDHQGARSTRRTWRSGTPHIGKYREYHRHVPRQCATS